MNVHTNDLAHTLTTTEKRVSAYERRLAETLASSDKALQSARHVLAWTRALLKEASEADCSIRGIRFALVHEVPPLFRSTKQTLRSMQRQVALALQVAQEGQVFSEDIRRYAATLPVLCAHVNWDQTPLAFSRDVLRVSRALTGRVDNTAAQARRLVLRTSNLKSTATELLDASHELQERLRDAGMGEARRDS